MDGFNRVGVEHEDAALVVLVVMGLAWVLWLVKAVDNNTQEQLAHVFDAAAAVFMFCTAR